MVISPSHDRIREQKKSDLTPWAFSSKVESGVSKAKSQLSRIPVIRFRGMPRFYMDGSDESKGLSSTDSTGFQRLEV